MQQSVNRENCRERREQVWKRKGVVRRVWSDAAEGSYLYHSSREQRVAQSKGRVVRVRQWRKGSRRQRGVWQQRRREVQHSGARASRAEREQVLQQWRRKEWQRQQRVRRKGSQPEAERERKAMGRHPRGAGRGERQWRRLRSKRSGRRRELEVKGAVRAVQFTTGRKGKSIGSKWKTVERDEDGEEVEE